MRWKVTLVMCLLAADAGFMAGAVIQRQKVKSDVEKVWVECLYPRLEVDESLLVLACFQHYVLGGFDEE